MVWESDRVDFETVALWCCPIPVKSDFANIYCFSTNTGRRQVSQWSVRCYRIREKVTVVFEVTNACLSYVIPSYMCTHYLLVKTHHVVMTRGVSLLKNSDISSYHF